MVDPNLGLQIQRAVIPLCLIIKLQQPDFFFKAVDDIETWFSFRVHDHVKFRAADAVAGKRSFGKVFVLLGVLLCL